MANIAASIRHEKLPFAALYSGLRRPDRTPTSSAKAKFATFALSGVPESSLTSHPFGMPSELQRSGLIGMPQHRDLLAQSTVWRTHMAWVKLTDANGSSVFVNTDNVLWFSASGEDGHAWLITTTNERDKALSLHVKQSPAEVVALLRSARQEVADVIA